MTTALQNAFAKHGYNLVSLPKSGIAPLLLLYKVDNDVSSAESPLTKLFPSEDIAPPAIQVDKDVMPIIGSAEATFDGKSGISFLNSLLEKLHLGKANAKINLNDQDTLTFSFQDIKEDSIDLLSLDEFITNTPPDMKRFNAFGEKLKKSELYIVTAVLKSTSFSIKITDKSGENVDVEAKIKGILETNVNVTRAKNNSVRLAHKDKQVPLIFAFKAQRIIYDKPSFWSNKPATFKIINQPDVVLRDEGDFETEQLNLGTQTASL